MAIDRSSSGTTTTEAYGLSHSRVTSLNFRGPAPPRNPVTPWALGASTEYSPRARSVVICPVTLRTVLLDRVDVLRHVGDGALGRVAAVLDLRAPDEVGQADRRPP